MLTYNLCQSTGSGNFAAWQTWNGAAVLLKWSTATKTENDFFTVERHTDGITFAAIGNPDGVNAVSGTVLR